MSIFNGGVEKLTNDSSSGGIYKIGLYPINYSSSNSIQTIDVSISGFTDLDKMLFIYDEIYTDVHVTNNSRTAWPYYINSRSLTKVQLKCTVAKSSGKYVCVGMLYVIQFI